MKQEKIQYTEAQAGAKAEAKVAGNQRQIPIIQTQTDSATQIQQNTNKVLRNLSNNVDSLTTSINQTNLIGEIKLANLTLTQFQSVAGSGWILANGQSSVDTSYSKLTGNNTVPTITVAGTTAFIKVN